MDIFYEESSITRNAVKESKKYKVVNIIANIFLALGIAALIFGFTFIPIKGWLIWGFFCAWFFLAWFLLGRLKRRYNLNYDYSFVSGELRIARVFNINRRKLLTRIQSEDIIQMGDADSTSFERFREDPTTKTVFCTSNVEAGEGKFFLYLLVNENGKKLYVLECREELLVHMLKFVKRSVLDSEYVAQEKKVK